MPVATANHDAKTAAPRGVTAAHVEWQFKGSWQSFCDLDAGAHTSGVATAIKLTDKLLPVAVGLGDVIYRRNHVRMGVGGSAVSQCSSANLVPSTCDHCFPCRFLALEPGHKSSASMSMRSDCSIILKTVGSVVACRVNTCM